MNEIAGSDVLSPFAMAVIAIGSLGAVCFAFMSFLRRKRPINILNLLDFGVMESSGDDDSGEEFFEAPLPSNDAERNEAAPSDRITSRLQQHLFEEDGSLSIPVRAVVTVIAFTILLFLVPPVDSSSMSKCHVRVWGNSIGNVADGIPSNVCCYVLKDNKIYIVATINGDITSVEVARFPFIKIVKPNLLKWRMKLEECSFNIEWLHDSILGNRLKTGLPKTGIENALGGSAVSSSFKYNKLRSLEQHSISKHQYYFFNNSSLTPLGIHAMILSYKIILVVLFPSLVFSFLIVLHSRYNKTISDLHNEEL